MTRDVAADAETFVHLRVHSDYSISDGLLTIKSLVERTLELAMPAVAVTDRSNLYGAVKFYSAALEAGIKPILGCDFWFAPSPEATPCLLTLLAQNATGYRNLMELVSRCGTDGLRSEQGSLGDPAWLSGHSEGLIALSGGREGDIARALAAGYEADADACLAHWLACFDDRFYLEVSRTGRAGEDAWVHAAVQLAARCDCPLVATNDVRFLDQDDFEAHEARVCIQQGRVLADPRRPRHCTEQQYLRTPEAMRTLFPDLPEALANTLEIARRCTVEMCLDTPVLPAFPTPEGATVESLLEELACRGLEQRLEKILDRQDPAYASKREVYEERFRFELQTIVGMGYAGYFLIVAEFVDWAKNNAIPVGPGRGSGAGSLVAYALGITNLDPLLYDLLFERFLNPERVSMPDFDVDFCMEGRERVLEHVINRYGKEAFAQIITHGTMAAKAVVRDVARVQGKPHGLADRLAKLIPAEPDMTLHKALAQEEALQTLNAESEEVSEIMEMAFRLEGLVRNIGKHAAGVVIAPGKLTDYVPLMTDDTGSLMTQFDMKDIERTGLVKFDFLGLRTLTIIDWTLTAVNALRREQGEADVVIDELPLDDPRVFQLLRTGETAAVFQLESLGIRNLTRKLQPDCFEDLIALVAMYRPGPLESGMMQDFLDCKHGRAEVSYPHPDLEPVLVNTYGVILYQEQVQRIAQVLAGYTLGGADVLRRAMGKKKPEEMEQQRAIFSEGARKNGIDEATATHIFNLMAKFAGYGFNKSHSAGYALVAYQTAWLKTHYPAPFMAAALSAQMQATNEVVKLIADCQRMGIEVVPPDVNRGDYRFVATREGAIVYGLGAVKGVGEGPVAAIVEARATEPFTDVFDLCCRVDALRLNRRPLEALVRAGAADSLAPPDPDGRPHRACLLASLDDALRFAGQLARSAEAGMRDMFGEPDAALPIAPPALQDVRPCTLQERLADERATLGFYLTGHPVDIYAGEITQFAPTRLGDLTASQGQQTIAGLLVEQRVIQSRAGKSIAFVTLEDGSGSIELVLNAALLAACQDKLIVDTIIVAEGEVGTHERFGSEVLKMHRTQAVYTITEARQRFARILDLDLSAEHCRGDFPEQLQDLLAAHGGGRCPVAVRYRCASAEARLRFGDEWRVTVCDDLLQGLQDSLGADAVRVRYGPAA